MRNWQGCMEETIQQGYFVYHDETTNEWSAGKRYLAQQQIQKPNGYQQQ